MTISVDAPLFVAFFLAMVRAATWTALTPPFSNRAIPLPVRSGLAMALAIAAAPHLAPALGPGPFDTATLIGDVVLQAVIGASLGFLALMLFSAVQTAGSLVDVMGGFSISAAYDPLLQAQSTVFGRLYEMVMIVLLFAINGHLMLVKGFLTSFNAIGLQVPSMARLGEVLTKGLTTYFVASVEVAAPLLAALFLAQVALGLVARAVPSMNVFAISFPFTILLTFLLAGLALPALPGTVRSLVDQTLRSGLALGK